MPKMKTHKGVKKRVRVTSKGKIKHRHSNTGHLMSGKSGNRRRGLRAAALLGSPFRKRMIAALAGQKP